MDLNPNIILQAGQGVPRLETPYERLMKRNQAAQQENQLKMQQMQMADMERQGRMAEEGRSILAEAKGNYRAAGELASSRGLYDHAERFSGIADKHDSEIALTQKALAEMDEKRRSQTISMITEAGKAAKWIQSLPPEQRAKGKQIVSQQLGRWLPQIADATDDDIDMMVSQASAFMPGEAAVPASTLGKTAKDIGAWKDGRIDMSNPVVQAMIRKDTTHAPATNISLNTTQERAESKGVGEYFGGLYMDTQKGAYAARNELNRLARMEQLLNNVSTGKLEPTKTEVAALAESFGIKLDPNLGAKQAAMTLSNEIALSLRNPAGGAGMPGAMSDPDREFLVSMTPGLAKTPEGNKQIILTAKKLAQRRIEVANMARQYRKTHGQIDEGFEDQVQAYADANPLFGGQKPKPQAAPQPSRPRATNPQTGEIVEFDGRNWVKVK